MNSYEQRVRELAYQIWESEGRPAGHEYRHWEMACKLAEAQADNTLERVTGSIPSIIAPDEPFNPDPEPEIDPASPQPGQPTPPAHPSVPPRINKPVADYLSAEEVSSPVAVAPLPQSIQPAARKRKVATKSAGADDQLKPAKEEKQSQPRKAAKKNVQIAE